MYTSRLNSLTFHIDKGLSDLQAYLRKNTALIFVLATVALAAYGFELFSLNLTIDEEVHATYTSPTVGWITQGRWGMYLLNKFVLPYTIIPFVPLFVALVFHVIATLLLLESWDVSAKPDQFVVGALYVGFPTMAYMYTFSTISYGIGIGLFCVALSLFIYSKNSGLKRFWAIIPASFAIAIYQGFIPALAVVFLVHLICILFRGSRAIIFELLAIAAILIISMLIYYAVQKLILIMGIIPGLMYVSGFFDLDFLRHYFGAVLYRAWVYLFLPVYSGHEGVYSIRLTGMGILLVILSISFFVSVFRSRLSLINRILVVLFFVTLLVLPFLSSLAMQGYMSYRFLMALPAVIAAVAMLGMMDGSRLFKIFVTVLASYCIFQFVVSTNHLFASSHLALEADRLFASRVISSIEDAQAEADSQQLKYIEVIGYYDRPSTELIPKIETFGASFFEWEQGSPFRIARFLETVGFSHLEPLTVNQRARLVSVADTMPAWPHKDSIRIVNDAVLVKLSDYSAAQKAIICGTKESRSHLKDKRFCKGLPKPK